MQREFEGFCCINKFGDAILSPIDERIRSMVDALDGRCEFVKHEIVLILIRRFVFDVTSIIQAFNVKRRLMKENFWVREIS